MIEGNVRNILLEIENTDTELIAVSKNQTISKIKEVYDVGIRDFGENKVQELLSKTDHLPKDIRWHMIGHLQTNKVKDIIDKVILIHSVDSVKLAKAIDKEAKKKDIKVNILLEINIADEATKYGFKVNELESAINSIKKLGNITIQGFMCIAPNVENPEDNRIYFQQMYQLKEQYGFPILSMGMSNDYEIAIQEKSNYVRIGTKIFGPRLK